MELGKVQGPLGKNSSESNPRSAKLAPAISIYFVVGFVLFPTLQKVEEAWHKSFELP